MGALTHRCCCGGGGCQEQALHNSTRSELGIGVRAVLYHLSPLNKLFNQLFTPKAVKLIRARYPRPQADRFLTEAETALTAQGTRWRSGKLVDNVLAHLASTICVVSCVAPHALLTVLNGSPLYIFFFIYLHCYIYLHCIPTLLCITILAGWEIC